MENLILIILIIPIALTSYVAFSNVEIFDNLKFNAYAINQYKQWYRFFSYAFIHASWTHLILNVYVLWAFGLIVIQFFKMFFGNLANIYFLGLFIPAITVSTIFSFFKNRHNPSYNAVGASGAISAVVFSSIVLYPQGQMVFIFLPFMIPSWIFGGLYLIFTVVMARKQIDNIGHDAHLWGAFYGIAYTFVFVPNSFNNLISYIFHS